MKEHFLTVVTLILTQFLFTHGITYLDEELESIIIDDTPKSFSEEPESTTIYDGDCTTSSGFSGTCKPLNDCYPHLADFQADLQNLINSTAEYCSEGEVICCPSSNFILTKIPKSTNLLSNFTDNLKLYKEVCGKENDQVLEPLCEECKEARFQLPWTVALLRNGRQFCGGSLISETYILTAAHCVQTISGLDSVKIFFGDHKSRNIRSIKYHKGFSMRHLENNIALIELKDPVEYSKAVKNVCLRVEPVSYPGNVKLTGWFQSSSSRVVRFTNISLVNQSDCNKSLQEGTKAQITSGMLCAGCSRCISDACSNWSSGGSLINADGTLVGISSWRYGCGDKPGVYTAVNAYFSWITRNAT